MKRLRSLEKWKALEGEAIQLTPFLQTVCERAKAGMNDRKLCVIQEFDENAELRIDRGVLEKVCTGLLRNAIENTPDDGMVEVSIKQGENETLVTITDHGVGITPTNQEMIFSGFFHTQSTAFYASKSPYAFNAGGTGADLLRIKSFAKRLGFEVTFSSTRCPFLPRDEDVCPGKIAECRFVSSPQECLASGGSSFSCSLIRAGSKKGSLPDVKTSPIRAVQKKRTNMASPRIARRFFLKRRQNSCSLVRFGATGSSRAKPRKCSSSLMLFTVLSSGQPPYTAHRR